MLQQTAATVPVLLRWLAAFSFAVAASLASAQDYEAGKQAYLAKNYDRALEILKPLAEQGDSDAQVTLGLMYEYGHGVERNPDKAIEWYTRAAEQGLPVVQHDLGVKYFQGTGVPQNYQEAAKWWEQAANAGLADSQFNLGLMYYRGLGIKKNYAQALDLFTRAAEQNHVNAQYSLAVMYAFGQGVDKNYEKALKLFQAAADKGVAQAQYNLGVFYENGYGVKKDLAMARQWYEKAADQNVAKARERLGVLQKTPAASAPDKKQVAATATRAPEAEAADDSASGLNLRRDEWVRKQAGDQYTLQLISLTDEQGVRDYLIKHGLSEKGGYIAVTINNVQRYNAIYGHYHNYDEAKAAIESLPEAVRRGKPWVRNFSVLQKVMQ